jgi:D-3-phosphoglycerate dehydrogenase
MKPDRAARARVLLTYPSTAREMWFGERCLAAMRGVADVVLNPTDEVLAPRALAELGRGCTALVLDRLTPVTAELLALMPDLVAVVRGGVDHRHVDVAAASAAGVLVTQVDAAYQASVAELVIALMLDAARSVTHYATTYRAGSVPRPLPGRQVAGATVGIVGYGRIARRLAAILHAMGARVLAYDHAAPVDAPAERVALEFLVETSDYVVPMAHSTPGAPPLIDGLLLRRMKPTAWLVNAARGDLVDEAALERALDARILAGAAMDVGWAVDQMPSPHLARRPDVIATPHVGGITRESFESHAMQTVDQVAAIVAGRMPAGALNPDAAQRLERLRSALSPNPGA